MHHSLGLIMVAAYFVTMILACYLYTRKHRGN